MSKKTSILRGRRGKKSVTPPHEGFSFPLFGEEQAGRGGGIQEEEQQKKERSQESSLAPSSFGVYEPQKENQSKEGSPPSFLQRLEQLMHGSTPEKMLNFVQRLSLLGEAMQKQADQGENLPKKDPKDKEEFFDVSLLTPMVAQRVKIGDFEEASTLLEQLLQIDPLNHAHQLAFAYVLLKRKENTRALQMAQLARMSGPKDPWAFYFLAQAHMALKQLPLAEAAFRRVEELSKEEKNSTLQKEAVRFLELIQSQPESGGKA